MFRESKLVNLILTLLITLLFLIFSRGYRRPRFPLLYLGFFFILLAYIFAVTGAVIFPVFCSLAEHLCYAASGLSFLVGCLKLARKPEDIDG